MPRTIQEFMAPQPRSTWAAFWPGGRSAMAPLFLLGLIVVIVAPLPPMLVDVLVVGNLALSILMLLAAAQARKPSDFTTFPTLLLGATLLRLALNVACTRLILGADAATPQQAAGVAGSVIQAFAHLVAGSSLIVGAVMFAVFVIVQFVVVTAGASRVSEVAARFALDGMPGRQMAVDADLQAGLIDAAEAQRRRAQIAGEADFHGAMDGACRFVRGDAVAGLIITAVNIVGGLAVGVLQKGWTLGQSLDIFTRLSIGDGLASQLPAFITALAAGLLVTRSNAAGDLGEAASEQLGGNASTLGLATIFLAALALAGMPALPVLCVAGLLGWAALRTAQGEAGPSDTSTHARNEDAIDSSKVYRIGPARKHEPARSAMDAPPLEAPLSLPSHEPLVLELGHGLLRLLDENASGGPLTRRLAKLRRALADELGMPVPAVRVRDNRALGMRNYAVLLHGQHVAGGQAHPGRRLALLDASIDHQAALDEAAGRGIPAADPVFGAPAVWIADAGDNADASGAERSETSEPAADAAAVLLAHVAEAVRRHAHEMLGLDEVAEMVDSLGRGRPRLVEELLGADGRSGGAVRLTQLQAVFRGLLCEGVPLKPLELIAHALVQPGHAERDATQAIELARAALHRTLTLRHATADTDETTGAGIVALRCVSLDSSLERSIGAWAAGNAALDPQALAWPILQAAAELAERGLAPVVLTTAALRPWVRRLVEAQAPQIAVLSHAELSPGSRVVTEAIAKPSRPTAQAA